MAVLFSNTVAPIVGAALEAFKMRSATTELRTHSKPTPFISGEMTAAGFAIRPGVHPIVPIMWAMRHSVQMADALLTEEFMSSGLVTQSFPKVRPESGSDSAGHTRAHLDKAISAFTKVGRELASSPASLFPINNGGAASVASTIRRRDAASVSPIPHAPRHHHYTRQHKGGHALWHSYFAPDARLTRQTHVFNVWARGNTSTPASGVSASTEQALSR